MKDRAEPWMLHLGTDSSPWAQDDKWVRALLGQHVSVTCLN